MPVAEVMRWMKTLPPDADVAIDDGGLALVEVGGDAYIEVGGQPAEAHGRSDDAREIAARIAAGEDPVRRLVTMRYFTYEMDGDEVLFSDELKARVEGMAGQPLVECTPAEYPGERVLRFADPQVALRSVKSREGRSAHEPDAGQA